MTRAAAFLLVVMPLACAPEDWKTEAAFVAPARLNGCAVGDLDPRRPGNEIATVAATGEVFLVYRADDGWKHERIARVAGEMIQCAIGDVDPARAGNELVVVGMKEGVEGTGAGAAHVVWLEKDAWKSEPVFEDGALIHGVCVGDLDPDRAGNEILCVGFSGRATVVAREGGAWKATASVALVGAGKTAVAFRGGAAVACTSGALVLVRKQEGAWTAEVLDRAPAGLARIATDGTRLLVGRDDGALGLFDKTARVDIHKEDQRLRGAVLADLDPNSPGVEAATAGYSGRVTVLHAGWTATTVFEDTGKLHHLASGTLPGCGDAPALVTCGFSKRLTVIYRKP